MGVSVRGVSAQKGDCLGGVCPEGDVCPREVSAQGVYTTFLHAGIHIPL